MPSSRYRDAREHGYSVGGGIAHSVTVTVTREARAGPHAPVHTSSGRGGVSTSPDSVARVDVVLCPSCGEENPAKFPPITAGEFLSQRLREIGLLK